MVNLTTRCPQRGRNNPAILTAAPFCGLPQPEAHGRRNLTTRLICKGISPCAFVLCPDFSG
ncbi:hypothetical protein FQY21_24130 [Escherichia coli]|nr:hypothetical protein [Escherichia coli]